MKLFSTSRLEIKLGKIPSTNCLGRMRPAGFPTDFERAITGPPALSQAEPMLSALLTGLALGLGQGSAGDDGRRG